MERFLTPANEAVGGGGNSGKRRGTSNSVPAAVLFSQLHGRMQCSQRGALVLSTLPYYSEVGKTCQMELSNRDPSDIFIQMGESLYVNILNRRHYVSCLDFDSKGVYVASVTSSGSLAVHDYECLLLHTGSRSGSVAPVVQLCLQKKLEAVRWNPHNQDEVACVAGTDGKVLCYDLSCVTNRASEILTLNSAKEKKQERLGLLDLSYCKLSDKRVIACGWDGEVHVWDRRKCKTSMCPLSIKHTAQLTCLALSQDEQIAYVGSGAGQVYAWDFRGGRNSAAFMTPGEVYNPPLATWKINTLLKLIPSLLAQTEIETSGVQSININPCCPQQLAFHLNNGWSGVLDLLSLHITHMHCPPPPWIYNERDEDSAASGVILRRRPTWLFTTSIYACGSSSSSKLSFLDFRMGPDSADYVEENGDQSTWPHFETEASEQVVACAAHPLNDDIIAGTKGLSMLTIRQTGHSVGDLRDNI